MSTIAEYVRDPAPSPSLNATVAHLLLTKSARHAWLAHPKLNPSWEPEEDSQMDFGTICHAMLLEKDESRLSVIEAPDWRTKLAKEARADARARGMLPILTPQYGTATLMVKAARQAIEESGEIAAAFADGLVEQTMIWQEGERYCRCRPDLRTKDGRLLIDYKTTQGSAEPDAWGRGPLLSMGYDLQAAFGLSATRAIHKPRDSSFVFMVQETEPPYAVAFIGLSPAFEDFALQKFRGAVERWNHCLETDSWPSYPSRICWAEPPAWAVTRWEEARLVASTEEPVDEL